MALEPFDYTDSVATDGYLLIEAANLRRDQIDRLPQMTACTPVAFTDDAVLMPKLLCLSILDAEARDAVTELLEATLDAQRPPAVCAWLKTKAAEATLSSNIAKFLIGRGPEGTRVLWRYYDPRVFALAALTFDEAQRRAILGPIETWAFPWRHRWWQLSSASAHVEAMNDVELGWPTEGQWDVFQWSAHLSRLHARLDGLAPAPAEIQLQEVGEPVRHFREASTYWHLSDIDERCEYAYLLTRYGRAFRDHIKLAHQWQFMRTEQVSWRELLACLSDQDYRRLELHRSEKETI